MKPPPSVERVLTGSVMLLGTFALNTVAALLMGVLIGLERQWRQHTAGLRTNALVALGAALFVGMSTLIDHEASPTRIAAQVVSGLGFLGGGVILREGLNVRGLNTAATIWCSGAVGSLAGAGFPLEALLGTAGVLFVHLGLRPVTRWIDARTKSATDVEALYRLRVETLHHRDAHIRHILMRHVNGHEKLTLQGIATDDEEGDRAVVVATIYSPERNDRAMEEIVARVSLEPEVKAVSWQRTAA
ncbi:MAG: MgtC/SapB family protein [Gemmataceae bacterium]|nr:MgtC/SapB family protein [Gemmata sp.]MDW8197619.1 MgtC/SapB family protein [Gemmataceae bacterium]